MASDSNFSYLLAGLTVRSEIMLPELVACNLSGVEPDVEIRIGHVPEQLENATQSTFETATSKKEVLIKIPDVARYHVQAGRLIQIDPMPGVQAKNLRLFLLGSALGALYFQRGDFPLHASVVVINEKAVAFSGDSGAGKSTLAAWMSEQGYPLLCDDVCVIRFDEQDTPMAFPGFPRLKLWNDALDAFGMDASTLQKDYSRADKYHLSASEKFWDAPVPLRYINFLQYSEDDQATNVEAIKPAQAVPLLRNNTYRFQYISGLDLTRSHFLDCVRLSRSVKTQFLYRPKRHSSLSECQSLIEKQML